MGSLGAIIFGYLSYMPPNSSKQLEQQRIEKIKSVIEPYHGKMLEVTVTGLDFGRGRYGGHGLGIRFYDVDGDGKTVEQYVRSIETNTLPPYCYRYVETDLIRQGQKPEFNPQNINNVRREMTKTEAAILDKEYQGLLGKFKE